MIFKAGLVTLASSLVLLLPVHGKIQAEPSSLYKVPKPLKTLAIPPLSDIQPVEPIPTPPVVTYTAPAVSLPTGSCGDWLAQAGIPITYGVMELINGESGCRPTAYNPSGACGIGQDINGCEVGYDPVAQLIWMNNYVLGRYKTWANAYGTWLSRYPHWY